MTGTTLGSPWRAEVRETLVDLTGLIVRLATYRLSARWGPTLGPLPLVGTVVRGLHAETKDGRWVLVPGAVVTAVTADGHVRAESRGKFRWLVGTEGAQ